MKNSLIISVLFFLTGLDDCQAQQKLPSNFHMTRLENGLEILVIEDPSVPLATLEICVHNGSFAEDSAYNGLSHLYEHMFFKANKDLPSQEKFLERVRELGVVFNGTTTNERVNYFITLGKEKVVDGLQFLNSAIRYPLFLESEMKKENPVVDGEFQRAESNPLFFLFNDMNRQLWGDLYSRKNIIGDHNIILTATPEKMRVIKDRYYYPDNTLIVVAGDVKAENVFIDVKKIFSDWSPAGFNIFEKYPVPEFKPLQQSSWFLTENTNARTPMLMMGLHGPDTRNDMPATYAADVFTYILGQKGSKFQKELVDDGLAYQVQASYQTCKYVGPIQIILVPNPAKVREAYAKLIEHMAQWDSDDYFTNEQLETAKQLLAIAQTRLSESTSTYVHNVTYWWASANIDYYTGYIENLRKVTREDIRQFVRKYIKGKPMTTGLLVSPEMKTQMGITDVGSYLR